MTVRSSRSAARAARTEASPSSCTRRGPSGVP
jgi:hypothetical protein